ncbi:fungal-specific transcription factor domain-containing protein [Mycena floridula]|nr:fungal-specific transcription factor domain-containing protein [Mycena floridula]
MPDTPGAAAVKKRRLQAVCLTVLQSNVGASTDPPMKLKDSPGDSGNMPGRICSKCIAIGSTCTHSIGKRAEVKMSAIPQNSLQMDPTLLAGPNLDGLPRLLDLEDYAPTSSKAYGISTGAAPQGDVQNTLIEFSEYIKVLEARLASKDTSEPNPENPDNTDAILADSINSMSMSNSRGRFYGKSSNAVLLNAASVISKAGLRSHPNAKRAEMWQIHPWQVMQESRPPFLVFPAEDLMETLIDLYFTHYNLLRPLLHRPSFEKSVHEGLHHRNYYFGATVLVVCALGSKYSDDFRVFLDGIGEQSCGWPFFSQVQPLQGTSLASPPSLYELQYYSLSAIFLHGSSVIESSWSVLGIALRLAQDVGLHRKMAVEPEATADNESWKRIFWSLASMDRLMSTSFGRPPGLNSDDIDQEYPLECDDEYWVHTNPKKAFKQPADRPSTISYFVSYLKLVGVMEMAQRTLYATNSPIPRKQAISQLDEALAQWMDSVPEHLRWDPSRKDLVFFKQSGCLYTTYYYIKMIVHRPELLCSLSNLAILADAAKRCIDVLEHLSRKAPLSVPIVHAALFTSAAMLFRNHWKNPSRCTKDLDDVRRCLKLLNSQAGRWKIAARFCDIIIRLLTCAERHESLDAQVSNRKRQQESWASTSQLSNQTSASWSSKSHSVANKSKIAFQVEPSHTLTDFDPANLSYPTWPSLNLPTDTTEAEIERLLLSTTLPDFEAMEHLGVPIGALL